MLNPPLTSAGLTKASMYHYRSNMFDCLIILLYSTSVLAIPAGRNEVVYPSLETLRSGIKIMKLRAFNQDIELKLEPAGDVISDDFVIIDEAGKIEATNVKIFKEKLYRDQEKGAALYIDENGFVEFEGIINSKLTIQPSGSQKVRDGMREHLITETLEEEKHFRDAVYNFNWTRSFSEDKARDFNEDQCVEIEYFFVAEKDLSKKYADLKKFNANLGILLIQVQTMMDTLKLKIKIRLIGVSVLKSDPPFITDSVIPGEDVFMVDLIMTNMMTFLCQNKENQNYKRADIVMLVTGKEIGFLVSKGTVLTGILGAAVLGGACTDCTKYAVIKWEDDKRVTAATVAHESAHLLGSPHDGESGSNIAPGSENCPANDKFLMSNRYSSGKNGETFSTCSRENIIYFLGQSEASCVIKQCQNTVL